MIDMNEYLSITVKWVLIGQLLTFGYGMSIGLLLGLFLPR
jgi:hypothetical protein